VLDIHPSAAYRERECHYQRHFKGIHPVPDTSFEPIDIATLASANPDHWKKAAAIRALALDGVAAANSGHTGMPIGMADVATVLFEKHLKFDAKTLIGPIVTASSCRQVTVPCWSMRCCT
jgi:hypothetical protein